MRGWAAAGLVLLVAMGIRPAAAQPLDLSQGGPITITSLGGIEWRQNEHEVIARGDARAVRGAVTVTADELIAHYRRRTAGAVASAAAPLQPGTGPGLDSTSTGGQEIFRLEAIGHVHIYTATDQAFGDHAVYDLDEAVLVLTGRHLKLTTPQETLTARDDLEYWPDKHMAVARGDAVVTTNDGRRLTADTLVAYTTPGSAATAPGGNAGATTAARAASGSRATDPLADSGKIERVEAFGNVTVRTATETISGDRGVYVPATGIALILDHVRITRGQNQLNGARGVVDMKTGVAELLAAPGQRVQGLVVPNSANESNAANGAPPVKSGQPGTKP